MQIYARAHAKINWNLCVGARRADGYHDLRSYMQSIALHDSMTFRRADALSLCVVGTRLPADENNSVIKAAQALRQAAQVEQGAAIELTKRIPIKAGLGGGSADCAATLLSLNRLWQLNWPQERLHALASKLGADVPFCLTGGLCRASGIGEVLEKLPSLADMPLVILHAGRGLSTARVFAAWDAQAEAVASDDEASVLQALQTGDLNALTQTATNSFQRLCVQMLPAIGRALRDLRANGAAYVRMTGSGSAVYGVFRSMEAARRAHRALKGRYSACELTHLSPCGVTLKQE